MRINWNLSRTVCGLCLNCVWTVSGRCLDFIRALSEPTIDSVLTVSSHSPGHVLTVSVLTVSGPCLLFNPLKSRKPRKKLKSWHKRWTQKWLPGIKFSSRQSVFSAQFYSEYHLSMHARIFIFFLLTFEGVKHLWCRQKFVFELTKTSSYTHRKKLTMTGSLLPYYPKKGVPKEVVWKNSFWVLTWFFPYIKTSLHPNFELII